jgi:hypothetical protein
MGKLPIIAIIGSLGFFRAVLLPLLFLARAYFCGGMVEFSSADEPTRVDCGTVFIGWQLYLKARPSGLASPSLPTGEGEAYYHCQRHPTRPDLQDKPATRSTGSEERPTFLGGSDERPSTAGADEGEISLT